MKLCLIDASGYIFRAFYTRPPMVKSDGTPVGAIYGYCEMLRDLLRKNDATHMAVVLDAGRSGREQIDPNYKGNRTAKPPELITQLGMLADATASHGIATVKMDGMEADDVIATYALQSVRMGGEAVIYSSDKDLMQLLTAGVAIYDPLKNQHVDSDVCRERMGVYPHQVLDYLSIVGDASDNIPGVPSIGAKGAATLLRAHGDLDTILMLAEHDPVIMSCTAKQRESLRTNAALAHKSRELARLKIVEGCPDLDDLEWSQPDPVRLGAYLREMEFAILARDLEQQMAA